MDEDDPFALKLRSSAAETLEAASQRLKPVQRVSASLYRAVEVMREPNGRVTRIGKIWHSDLERVRRFGHALAANTAGEHVQVADSGGRVIETIPPPPPGTPPRGWGDWTSSRIPSREPPPPALPTVTARVPTLQPPPSGVPPIVPPALPASLASATARAMAPGQPALGSESRVERTNPLPPTHV
ncbi:MAG: hypothetical protein KDG57_09540 [Rhodoferax sp.]|nr:hypothetical protein [Rhodoferax sp.]